MSSVSFFFYWWCIILWIWKSNFKYQSVRPKLVWIGTFSPNDFQRIPDVPNWAYRYTCRLCTIAWHSQSFQWLLRDQFTFCIQFSDFHMEISHRFIRNMYLTPFFPDKRNSIMRSLRVTQIILNPNIRYKEMEMSSVDMEIYYFCYSTFVPTTHRNQYKPASVNIFLCSHWMKCIFMDLFMGVKFAVFFLSTFEIQLSVCICSGVTHLPEMKMDQIVSIFGIIVEVDLP